MSNASRRRQAEPACRQAARGKRHCPAYPSDQPRRACQLRSRPMTPASPSFSLPIATGLSITLHVAALISWPQPPGSGGVQIAVPSQLEVRFGRSDGRVVSPSLRPAPPQAHPLAATPPTRTPRPPASEPADRPAPPVSEPLPPREASELPLPVFPIEALSRLPTLTTEVSPEDWPSTPGAPSGRFRIEVDVGTDGRVMRVNPICEPQMCEAASIYAGSILGWRFAPAEILGHRVSSRIHVEFEIGSPESQGFNATPVTPSHPAAPVIRPSETTP